MPVFVHAQGIKTVHARWGGRGQKNEKFRFHFLPKGTFNNYVDKMRGRGSKNVCFCPCSGYKNCPRRGGGQKWQNFVHVVVECPLFKHIWPGINFMKQNNIIFASINID